MLLSVDRGEGIEFEPPAIARFNGSPTWSLALLFGKMRKYLTRKPTIYTSNESNAPNRSIFYK
jgi:hypothetical protein